MKKQGLLALACLSMLVLTPACRKKNNSDTTLSREHMKHQKHAKTVVTVHGKESMHEEPMMKKEAPKKKAVVKKDAPKKQAQPSKKMSTQASGAKKAVSKKTMPTNEHVGDKLRAEEINPEDVD